jgi:hypothetical protein
MNYNINPYTLYKITVDQPRKRASMTTPARLRRAQRASAGTTLVKAMLKRKGL